ncbi:MAG: hypothetical protein II438_07275 [Clostridiales bacterium]|nr:hypothetical protein [Clostridiales bacterium]
MKINIIEKTAVILVAAMLLPVLSSCSLFSKKAVLTAAGDFGEVIKTADASDILRKTDGTDRDYKKSFKELLDHKNYTEEEVSFSEHMVSSIEYTVDEKSVKIEKDKATVGMTFSVADLDALKKKDYKDINDLTSAVDSASKRDIEVTAELKKIDKEWYVTNFDDGEFKDLFSFYGNMPVIGRATLIETAGKLAETIKNDDSGAAIYLAGSNATPETIQAVKEYFDVDGNPTKEDNAFRAAVRDGMSYEIDETSVVIEGKKGSVNIILRRPNFEVLAGKNFSSIPEIEKAVKECEIINFEYKCELERNGTEWFVTNLDSVSFGGLLSYKKFKISMKSVDGTYKSTMDITDKFIKYISNEYKVSIPSDCEGRIYIRSTMVLKNGKYEVKIDRDAFAADIKSFVEKNIDKIIKNTLGTTSSVGLDAMAKIAGYKDYADMKQKILDQVTASVATINTSGLESKGTYTVSGNNITFKSATDTMPGTVDNFGDITVTAPVSDPDAIKLLDSTSVQMTYKKAA